MKKIIIVTRKLVFGGIEKALLEMVKNLPKDKYEITIAVMENGGILEARIPKNVRLINIYDKEDSIKIKIIKNIKKLNFYKVYCLINNTIKSYYTKDMYKSYNNISKTLNQLQEEYDIAISYTTPISFPVIYVINNIIAKNKIMWIHSDIDQFEDSVMKFKKYYYTYDYIFSVSKNGLEKFIHKFPKLKSRSDVYYNSIYEGDIQKLANKEVVLEKYLTKVKLTTVARLSQEKGIDLLIEVAKLLNDNGYDFIWNCIGEGDIRQELEYKIEQYDLKDKVKLIGAKENPYPYINECDIYVQPSRYEGYGITITEAKCLKKPIVTTNVIGATEQLNHEKNGLIVDISVDSIYQGIKRLIDDEILRESLIKNLKKTVIDTRNEVSKFDLF